MFVFFLELRIKKRSLPFIERGKTKGDEAGLREGRVLEAKEIIAWREVLLGMVTIENLYLSYFHMTVLCFLAQFYVFYWLMVNLWSRFVIFFIFLFFWFGSKMLFALANENLILILFQYLRWIFHVPLVPEPIDLSMKWVSI